MQRSERRQSGRLGNCGDRQRLYGHGAGRRALGCDDRLEVLGGDGFVPTGSLDISADGNTIVGIALSIPGNLRQGFRWTPTSGSEHLEPLVEGREAFALGISADGAVVSGVGDDADGDTVALRPTGNGAPPALPVLDVEDDCAG